MTSAQQERKITTGKVIEGGLFIGSAITSPLSLLSETMRIPVVKDAIQHQLIERATLTRQAESQRRAVDEWDMFGSRTRGGMDVFAITQAVGVAGKQLRRNIEKEVNEGAADSSNTLQRKVLHTNDEIFTQLKRTTGYTLGMVTDLVLGGGIESITGVPIPGVSSLRDHLLAGNPFLQSAEPKFFAVGVAITAIGLVAGAINVIREGQFARGTNTLLMNRYENS